MKTVVALLLLVIAIWAFRGKPDNSLIQQENALPAASSAEVSGDEINSFLYVWSDYVQQNISPVGRSAVSLESGRPEDSLSETARLWLVEHGWKPARFFYVQQRLRAILQTLNTADEVENTVTGLREQLSDARRRQPDNKQQGPDPVIMSLEKTINDMIASQQARVNIEQISNGELDAVRPYRKVYEAILDGRRTYSGE